MLRQMIRKNISLQPSQVKNFVDTASKCNFDVDIYYNRYVVDAKSILGVLGLDFKSFQFPGREFSVFKIAAQNIEFFDFSIGGYLPFIVLRSAEDISPDVAALELLRNLVLGRFDLDFCFVSAEDDSVTFSFLA